MPNNTNHRPILLVEDNPLDLDLTIRAFRKQHLLNPIEVARDGEQALEWISRWETGDPWPLVVLLDLKLPRVDGLHVLKRLKAHPKLSVIPVVVLTSSGENRDVETAYQLGANAYIIKPVDFKKFLKVAQDIELFWLATNLPPEQN